MKIRHITQYLFESFKDAQEKFSQEAPEDEVKQYIDTFKQLAKKGTVSGQEKDIGYWIKQGWAEFKGFMDSKSQEKSKSQVKKYKKQESIIAHDDEDKIVVIPLSKDASCYYGKNTKWCTAGDDDNKFIEYFYIDNVVLFYIFMKNNGEKYAAAYSEKVDKFEFFDEQDRTFNNIKEKTNITDIDLKEWYEEYSNIIRKAMDINNVSEDIQVELVKDEFSVIQHIDNPSEEVQLEAVRKFGPSIEYIVNPSYQVQLEAVKQDGFSIRYIENPTEEMKLQAVEKNGFSIRYIENPTEEMQLEAIKKSDLSIEFINNPTEKAKQLHKELWE